MCILQGKLTYTSKALHEARRPSKEDYMRYHLPCDIRARIISFGIRKRQMKHQYRRSRSGQNLFHHIAIISRRLKDTPTSIQNQTSRHENLIYPNLQTLKPNGIISLSHINARSVCNKTLELQTYITERSIDVCAITETWLRPDDQVTLPDITPSGYKALSKPRRRGRGGGIALIYKKDIPIKEIDISIEFQTIELAYYKVKIPSKVLDLLIIYRIPSTSVLESCNELAAFVDENITTLRGNLMLIGDLNIHMDEKADPGTVTFTDFLDSLGLVNHTLFPTHVSGHTLDLIITREDSNDILLVVRGHMLSDHHFIDVKLKSASEIAECERIKYRKLKNIQPQDFSNDVSKILGGLDLEAMDLYQAVEIFNNSLKSVLNKHAPLKSRTVKATYRQPWFDDKIKAEIILRRKKERDWTMNPSPYTLNAFYVQRRHVSNIIKMAR